MYLRDGHCNAHAQRIRTRILFPTLLWEVTEICSQLHLIHEFVDNLYRIVFYRNNTLSFTRSSRDILLTNHVLENIILVLI